MDNRFYTYAELRKLMEISYRSGFIEACGWCVPVSQDVDSKAFSVAFDHFVDTHHPFDNELDGL